MKITLSDWRIEDKLKTPEARAYYLEAAMEEAITENDPKLFAEALGDVAASLKGKVLSVFFQGVATGLEALHPAPAPRGARRPSKGRALAKA